MINGVKSLYVLVGKLVWRSYRTSWSSEIGQALLSERRCKDTKLSEISKT